MKTSKQSSFAFALVAIAVPAVALGIAVTSAASEAGYPAKDTQFDLFNDEEFRDIRRSKYKETPALAPNKESMKPAADNPCDPLKVETAEPALDASPLRYQDLSSTERDALRKQLRIGGCPTDVLPGYKALCEGLLRLQKKPATMRGLKNAEQ